MKCHRHRERDAVGVCAACGKGVCAEDCAHDGSDGLHCDETCARRLRLRERAGASTPVARGWSALLVLLGAALLYYGYRYSGWAISVPNLLGMLFLWYGVVLLLQRVANRTNTS